MRKQNKRTRANRGILSAWAVLAMVACLCCVSLVANSGYLSNIRSESNRCAQAATLAAGRALLTDDLLKNDLQSFEIESRYLQARASARAIYNIYCARARLPQLTDRQITIGSVVRSTDAPPAFLQNSAVPNRVQIVLSNSAEDDAAGALFMRGLTGVSRGRILSRAAVNLQNRIVGFRPSLNCPVPLLPLAIPDDPRSSETGYWSSDIEKFQGQDQWTWSTTDDVLVRTADRLPEIVVALRISASVATAGQARWVSIGQGNDPSDQTPISLDGIMSTGDVGSDLLTFPHPASDVQLSRGDLAEIGEGLRKVIGQPRIFPLYSIPESTDTADPEDQRRFTSASLVRPVAARVMMVESLSENELRITLQPCVLSTSTAVTSVDPSVPQNPYLWRICLVE